MKCKHIRATELVLRQRAEKMKQYFVDAKVRNCQCIIFISTLHIMQS